MLVDGSWRPPASAVVDESRYSVSVNAEQGLVITDRKTELTKTLSSNGRIEEWLPFRSAALEPGCRVSDGKKNYQIAFHDGNGLVFATTGDTTSGSSTEIVAFKAGKFREMKPEQGPYAGRCFYIDDNGSVWKRYSPGSSGDFSLQRVPELKGLRKADLEILLPAEVRARTDLVKIREIASNGDKIQSLYTNGSLSGKDLKTTDGNEICLRSNGTIDSFKSAKTAVEFRCDEKGRVIEFKDEWGAFKRERKASATEQSADFVLWHRVGATDSIRASIQVCHKTGTFFRQDDPAGGIRSLTVDGRIGFLSARMVTLKGVDGKLVSLPEHEQIINDDASTVDIFRFNKLSREGQCTVIRNRQGLVVESVTAVNDRLIYDWNLDEKPSLKSVTLPGDEKLFRVEAGVWQNKDKTVTQNGEFQVLADGALRYTDSKSKDETTYRLDGRVVNAKHSRLSNAADVCIDQFEPVGARTARGISAELNKIPVPAWAKGLAVASMLTTTAIAGSVDRPMPELAKVRATLEVLEPEERELVNRIFAQKTGSSLRDRIESYSATAGDKPLQADVVTLLDVKDGTRDDAGAFRRAILECRAGNANSPQAVRDMLRSMNKQEIASLTETYQKRYHSDLVADLVSEKSPFDYKTKETLKRYINGNHPLSDRDFNNLAQLSVSQDNGGPDHALFLELLSGSSADQREQLRSPEWTDSINKAFGAHWSALIRRGIQWSGAFSSLGVNPDSLGLGKYLTDDARLDALNAVEHGNLSIDRVIAKNTWIWTNDPQQIELALSRLSDEQRELYRRGYERRGLDDLSEQDRNARLFYSTYHGQLEVSAGQWLSPGSKKTQLAKWEDLIIFGEKGSFICKINSDQRYFEQNTRLVRNMSKSEWTHCKSSQQAQEVARCALPARSPARELFDQMMDCDSYESAREAVLPTLTALRDLRDPEGRSLTRVMGLIAQMNESERARYRTRLTEIASIPRLNGVSVPHPGNLPTLLAS